MGGLVKGFKGMIMPETFSVPASMEVKIGNPQQIPYSLLPLNSTNQNIRWSSANTNIATVDNNGTISGVAIGNTTITGVVDANGISQTLSLTVSVVPVTGISLNETKANLRIGQTIQLEATITPENASNKNVNWTSSNTSIATVDSTGLVTVISDGEVTITATTVDGGYTATCEVQTKWTPGENTISYFPFKEDFTDHKGNRTLTVNDCTIDNGSAKINSQSSYMTLSSTIGGSNITINVWYYYGAYSTGGGWNTLFARKGGTYHHFLMPATSSSGTLGQVGFYNSSWYPGNEVLQLGEWYNIIIVKSGNNQKIYINSKLVEDSNSSFDNNTYPLGIIANYDSGQTQGAQGRMSELFFENKLWTQEEITDYFNNSKADYGYDISYYQELEYIQSSGTQYILTNIKPTNNTKTEFKLSNWTETGSHQIFGEDVNWSSGDGGYSIVTDAYHFNGPVSCPHGLNNGNEHEGEFSQQGLYVDGVLKATPATKTFTASRPMAIFCLYRNGSPIEYSVYKLYYFKIYELGELVRDFIPVQRRSDGELGLFDKVEQKFYKNSGSGSFTAGPKIGIILDTNSITLAEAGAIYQLTATSNPSDLIQDGVTWKSSDITVATVSSTGLVTCVTPGECTITCSSNTTAYYDECKVAYITEYVLLSEGGSINRYSELAKSSNNTYTSLHDNGTTWRAQVTTTDRCTSMYKNFDKDIVKFEIKFQYTENYSYSGVYFILQPTVGEADSGSPGYFEVNNGQDTYSGWSGIKLYRGTTNTNYYPSSGVSTSDITVVGEKIGTTWTLTFTGGKSFTYTFEETNNCKRISFGGWRWRTGTQGYFKKVVVYLQ